MPRFFRRGVSELFFALTVADTAAPTSAEISAAADLSEDVAAISGWDFTSNPIQTPNLKDKFTPQIPGEDSVGKPTITFYDRDDTDSVRPSVTKGTSGFLIFAPYGTVSGKRCEVWHCEVSSASDNWSVGNEAAQFNTSWAVLDPPEQDAVTP